MDVFISWSGALSHKIAIELKTWLESVIQVLRPYVSSEDIDKGARWFIDISNKLDACDVGILCLTRDNKHADWLLFEAGALAKRLERGRVCTLLIDLAPIEVPSPLSQFQATYITKEDMKRLVATLNRALPPNHTLAEIRLNAQFDRWWPDFEDAVRRAVEESHQNQPQAESIIASLILPIVYREIDKCQVSDVFEWLQIYKNDELFSNNSEIKLVEGVLSRLCGQRQAFSILASYPEESGVRFHQAMYELALLKYAKPAAAAEISKGCPPIEAMATGLRKLWASLIGMCYLREGDMSAAKQFYQLANPLSMQEDANDVYGSIQIGILAAALGEMQVAESYLDLARQINTNHTFLTNGYPFSSLIARHEKAFVNTTLGKGESNLDIEWIRTLRGHSHVIAAHARTLRLCKPALDSLIGLSQYWKKPLKKEVVTQRLRQFEKDVLEKAGTLFVG